MPDGRRPRTLCVPVFPCFWEFDPRYSGESVADSAHHTSGMSKEIAMAKAKKRVAARKKSSKRGKANAKPARKLAAKQATSRKAKSKVKRTAMSAKKQSAKKPAGKKKQPREPMETAKAIETTPMNVIDEPAPGGVAVTEHESV
jgi:hypothetical protein